MTTFPLAEAPAAARRRRLYLGALIGALVERDARYRRRRQFARLDDHMLRDIGVTRADIRGL